MTKIYKEVTVTLEKTVMVGIEGDGLTDEAIDAFRKHFWHIEDSNGLFETVAEQYVREGSMFIEGVGEASHSDDTYTINIKNVSEYVDVTVQ